jgi:hypothetical protein
MRDELQRDDEIDALEQGRIANAIKDAQQVYDDGEEEEIKRVVELLGDLPEAGLRQLDSPDRKVKMEIVFVPGTNTATLRAFTVRASE